MAKTIAFVTNQYSCDRLIRAARSVADNTGSELIVVGVLDSEYALDPQVIDYLFGLSKQSKATMRLLFSEDKQSVMVETISQHDCHHIVTGMPNSSDSVLYALWKMFPRKKFHTVDVSGEIFEVAGSRHCTA